MSSKKEYIIDISGSNPKCLTINVEKIPNDTDLKF